jgi:peptidoglycan/xylan/chitin deacetylase (PgdA/CDA1 family)
MTLKKGLYLLLLILLVCVVISKKTDTPVFSEKTKSKKIPILMYHKVSRHKYHGGYGLRVPPENFEKQLKYLKKRGYNTVTLDNVLNYWEKGTELPPRPIVITFDDGYEDNYIFAYPLLKKYGYTATIFLVHNQIGGYNAWDAKDFKARINLVTWTQIREMQKYGISFQSHTLNHPNLATLPPAVLQDELALAKSKLEKGLGTPVNFIVYPYGKHNALVDANARKAGYKAGISVDFGKNDYKTNRFCLKRLRVNGYLTQNGFSQMLEQ